MLFKKKVDVADYCGTFLKELFTVDRDGDWERLREACNDPALSGIEKALYLEHVKAIAIRLMLIAIAKICDAEIASDARIYVETFLKRHTALHVYEIGKMYATAFEDAQKGGVEGMVTFLATHLSNSNLRPNTLMRLGVEFNTALNGHIESLKSIKLTACSASSRSALKQASRQF